MKKETFLSYDGWWYWIEGERDPRKNYKSRRCHFLTKVVLQWRSSGIARRRIITARFRKISSTQHYCFLSPWKSHFIHQCSAKHHYSFVFERRRRRKKSLNKTVALYYIYIIMHHSWFIESISKGKSHFQSELVLIPLECSYFLPSEEKRKKRKSI